MPKRAKKTKEKKWLEALTEVKQILDKAKVRYWLDLGTLLGAIRDGRFIAWDTDIDLGVTYKEAEKIISKIPELEKKGYEVGITDFAVYLSKELVLIVIGFYKLEDDKAWILFGTKPPKANRVLKYFHQIAEGLPYKNLHKKVAIKRRFFYFLIPSLISLLLRKILFTICRVFGQEWYALVIPKSYIEDLRKINFYNMEFRIPASPKKYLSLLYGEDWQMPNPNWHWRDIKAIDFEFFKKRDRSKYLLI